MFSSIKDHSYLWAVNASSIYYFGFTEQAIYMTFAFAFILFNLKKGLKI